MSREWKPGDVAMVDGMPSFYTVGLNGMAHWVFRNGGSRLASSQAEVRPLVVIDPEDRESIERLAKRLPAEWNLDCDDDAWSESIDGVQAALREFADPKPPRPDEPQGLGAVVEDADGLLWIRGSHPREPWFSPNGEDENEAWPDLTPVRVLSEGWCA